MTADEIAAAVAVWASEHFGGAVCVDGPVEAAGEGLDNDVVFARFSGSSLPAEWRAPLVLRSNPSPERLAQAEREAAIQAFCADAGYPAPRVLAVMSPAIQVMERCPGRPLLGEMTRRLWRAGHHVDALAGLHRRLHTLPTDGWPVPGPSTELADRRLGLVRKVQNADLARALARVEPLLPLLAVERPVVCHGDLHPLNVLVGDEGAFVVDWTDACLGDPHGDVARMLALLELAPDGAPTVARPLLAVAGPWLARRFTAAYGPLDPVRLALWRPVHVLHDWARSLVGLADPRESVVRVRPKMIDLLQARFEAAVVVAESV